MSDTYGKLVISGLTAPQQIAIRDAFNANVDRANIKLYSIFWDNSGNLTIDAGGPDANSALVAINTRINQIAGKTGVVSVLDGASTKMRTSGDVKLARKK